MKKVSALFLATLMLLCVFTACKDDKAPSANIDETNTPPGNVDSGENGDKTDDAVPGAEPKKYRLITWGDAIFCGYNTLDVMAAFAKADGIFIETLSGSYDNRNEAQTYSLYELFNYDGTEADSKITGIRNPESAAATVIDVNLSADSEPVDMFLLMVSRERGIGLESAKGRMLTAVKELDKMYQANNKDGKFVFVAYPPFQDGFAESDPASFKKWGLDTVGATTAVAHNELIKAHAKEMTDAVKTSSETVQVGDAFLAYYDKYYETTKISLYLDDLRTLSPAGAYFTGAVLYAQLFGNSPAKISIDSFIPENEAILLREAAHEIYFNTPASSVVRDYYFVAVKQDNEIKPEYAHEVYPEYYDVLMATALAYENRGLLVQYDKTSLNQVGSSSYRRRLTDVYPENNSPQKFLYADCSSFVRSAYDNTFGYNFKGAVDTSKLIELEEGCMYHYVGEGSPAAQSLTVSEYADGTVQPGYVNGKPSTEDEARKAFLDVLQPGDVIVYRYGSSGGHTILYMGNGKIIHCSGRRYGATMVDYNAKRWADCLEMSTGGVVQDDLDLFLYYSGRSGRHIFDTTFETKILRPFSLDLTPTQEALDRQKYLENIVAYKETTAPEGTTVSPGSDVKVTVTVQNKNSENKTVQIVETLPNGLTFKSGDGKLENGILTIDSEIKANSTETFTYVLTVYPSVQTGTLINCDTKICNVRMNMTSVRVGNTLTSDQQASIMALTEAAAEKSETDLELVLNLYKDGFSYTLPFADKAAAFNGIFESKADGSMIPKSGSGACLDLLALPLYGGQAVSTMGSVTAFNRIQYLFCSNFVAGDILLLNPTGDADSVQLWIYTGNDTFATIKDGYLKTLTGSATLNLREWVMGCHSFCVLRPSLGGFKAVEPDTPTEPDKPKSVPGRVLILGDIPLAENELTSTLVFMLGSEYNVHSEAYSSTPKTPVSRLEPYEIFTFADTSCLGFGTGARAKRIVAFIEEGIPEYIIFETGRRDTLNASGSAHSKTLSAFEWLSKTYPNTKIIAVAPAPYPDGTFTMTSSGSNLIGLSYTGSTAAEHAERIIAFAEACTKDLENVSVLKVCDAFNAAMAQGISLYGTEGALITHPNANGSYLTACMLQTAITGKPATGLAFPSGIDGAKLQAVADSVK